MDKEKDINVSINDPTAKVYVCIGLSRMPKHCGECPFYINSAHYDEDAFWGDGIVRACPFGCSHFGCLVERPSDCPLLKK